MPVPSAGTSTGLRLARIAALVIGSLVFLHAWGRSASLLLTDVWGEVLCAGAFAVASLVAAWFEVQQRSDNDVPGYREDEDAENAQDGARISSPPSHRMRTSPRRSANHAASEPSEPDPAIGGVRAEFRIESDGCTVRAKFVRSGALVFHGRDRGGDQPREWKWSFEPGTFAAIRSALGHDGQHTTGEPDLLELLEAVVPQLDRPIRRDPGAWLREHSIAATYREKDVDPERDTEQLPLLRTGLPRSVRRAGRRASEPTRAAMKGAPRRGATGGRAGATVSARASKATSAATGGFSRDSQQRRRQRDELPWQPGGLAPDDAAPHAEPEWVPRPPVPSAYPEPEPTPPPTRAWPGSIDSAAAYPAVPDYDEPEDTTARSRRMRYDRPSWERDASTPPSSEFSAVSARSRRLRHDRPSWERELSLPPGSSEFPAVRYGPAHDEPTASAPPPTDRPPLERRTRTRRPSSDSYRRG